MFKKEFKIIGKQPIKLFTKFYEHFYSKIMSLNDFRFYFVTCWKIGLRVKKRGQL